MYKIFFLILGFISTYVTSAYDIKLPIEDSNILPTGSGINILTNTIAYAVWIAWVLWVIGITWWGIQMVLSSGEEEKVKKWRYILIYSLIGVLLSGLAYSIVAMITNFRL